MFQLLNGHLNYIYKRVCAASVGTNRFLFAEQGVAAVEFAFILPILVTLYIGTVVTVMGIETKHKLEVVAETMGSLTGRVDTVDDNALKGIFASVNWLMAPYSPAPVKIKIASIYRNKTGQELSCWGSSLSNSTSPPTITQITPPKLADFGLSADVLPNETSLIVVEATYLYNPLYTWFSSGGPINLVDRYYARPRTAQQVSKIASNGSTLSCTP